MSVLDSVLAHNINTTISDIVRLLEQADAVRTRAKTVYYKCTLLLAASILEALLYHYIDCCCDEDPALINNERLKKLQPLQEISSVKLGSSKSLWIGEEISENSSLKKVTRDFNTMNRFCREKGLVDEKLFRELEYAREKRNQIHLQTLGSTARSYTIAMTERIGQAIDIMYEKLEDLHAAHTPMPASQK